MTMNATQVLVEPRFSSVTGRPIAVLGAGSWGTAIAQLVARSGHEVILWGRDEEVVRGINQEHQNHRYLDGFALDPAIRATTQLDIAVRDAEYIVMVVPSHAFREVCRQIAPLLHPSQAILHATKGVERESYARMSEIIMQETCVRQVGVISGPNIAREIMEGKPAGTVVATPFPRLVRAAAQLLTTPNFRVYENKDVVGVELGGTLKNIIAIAAGIAREMALGENAKAMLLTRGTQEMIRVGRSFGAQSSTFSGMAGIGDLIVTCGSEHSRNFRFGRGLAQGLTVEEIRASLGMVAEGVFASKVAVDVATERGIDIPVMRAVYEVIHEQRSVQGALSELMEGQAQTDVDFGGA